MRIFSDLIREYMGQKIAAFQHILHSEKVCGWESRPNLKLVFLRKYQTYFSVEKLIQIHYTLLAICIIQYANFDVCFQSRLQILRKALRRIIPPICNFQGMLLSTVLLSKLFTLLFLDCRHIKHDRSSPPEVFLRKGVQKICSKFTAEHPCQSMISIKLQQLY